MQPLASDSWSVQHQASDSMEIKFRIYMLKTIKHTLIGAEATLALTGMLSFER
jgi:hypothetical protein